ncbi:hypothetical protein FK220_000160 [Flavobacteriaceae bacterium TP-CH-4]|uniref:Uncharacterized protein n=1 Tax=Pelagihabitans pacificus TaxID=2696054 RepID=A0A967AUB4_9FLAO|nr:hypothetical protein [Pelagihabitans pacificus]NHF57732.1 hypothetical protein [Pelagihabitans pacificus]
METQQEANRQELQLQIEEWISDILFFAQDLSFTKHLLDHFYEELIRYENLDEIREEIQRFEDLRYSCGKLLDRTRTHLQHFDSTPDIPNLGASSELMKTQEILKEKFNRFMGEFKAVKSDIFGMIGTVLEHQKVLRNSLRSA